MRRRLKSLSVEYSPDCIAFGIFNALAPHTKYLHFLSILVCRAIVSVADDTLDIRILASVAGNRNRPRIHLLPTKTVAKKRAPYVIHTEPKR